MAEDGESDVELEDEEREVRHRINKENEISPKHCRTRIEQLAIPRRVCVLSLWQDHAYHLPRDKVERIKILLQELYAMSPEETERYFAQLKEESKNILLKKKMKEKLIKLLHKKRKRQQEKRAYVFFLRILSSGMEYAVKHPVPPLVSVRLRNLADIILEQICDLRGLEMPDRAEPKKLDSFLITISDWIAIAVEHLYYNVLLKKNLELELIEENERAKATSKEKDKNTIKVKPVPSSKQSEGDDHLMSEVE